MTDEEYKEFLEEYGDIETYIGEEVEKYKKETTELMDAVKLLVFVSLLNKVSKKDFKKKLEKNFKEYKNKIDKRTEKSYKTIVDLTNYINKDNYTRPDQTSLESALKSLMSEFDIKSTKTEDDKYIRTIENFYSKTQKTTEKDWVKINEYLSDKVSKFDKVEKTIAYYNKDGTIRAYFDLASYESMVYNTNLTNTGVREVIKDAMRRNYDVVYIEPHAYACPMCQKYQGYFYSLTGLTTEFNGIPIRKLEDVSFWNNGDGLFHPNCKHIPRKAYEDDEINTEYNSEKWEERYNDKQKINGLELKKQRIRNDMKVYQKLDDGEMVDKCKQQINAINRKIRELR